MNATATIIDVTPIAYSSANAQARTSEPVSDDRASSFGFGNREPGWRRSNPMPDSPHDDAQARVSGASYFDQADYGSTRTSFSPLRTIGGFIEVAAGVGLAAIGIPLLVLPGPGALTIAAGAFLVINGSGKLKR